MLYTEGRVKKISAVLMLDLIFIWLSLLYNDMFIILYASGIWVEFSIGLAIAITRSMLLFLGYHFRYPPFLALIIGVELVIGVMLSIVDVWIYFVTDCECLLRIDGAIVRLVVRSMVLTAVVRLIR
jgi:hypothetical protein